MYSTNALFPFAPRAVKPQIAYRACAAGMKRHQIVTSDNARSKASAAKASAINHRK